MSIHITMARKVEHYTIPEELVEKFNIYSKKSMIPKSRIVSMLIEKFLKNAKNDLSS